MTAAGVALAGIATAIIAHRPRRRRAVDAARAVAPPDRRRARRAGAGACVTHPALRLDDTVHQRVRLGILAVLSEARASRLRVPARRAGAHGWQPVATHRRARVGRAGARGEGVRGQAPADLGGGDQGGTRRAGRGDESTARADRADRGRHMSAIEIQGVSKRFGKVQAVRDLSFTVEAGRVTGFLGPNGAGKSTTLRMLLGLIHSDGGAATFAGRPLRGARPPERAASAPCSSTRASTRAAAGATTCGSWRPPGAIPESRVDEVLAAGGADRRGRPARQGLLDGHAPAPRDRRRAAGRPRGADPRRARQRARPAGHPLDPRAAAREAAARARRARVEPPAVRGRAERRRRRRDLARRRCARTARSSRCSAARTARSRASAPRRPSGSRSCCARRASTWTPTPPARCSCAAGPRSSAGRPPSTASS